MRVGSICQWAFDIFRNPAREPPSSLRVCEIPLENIFLQLCLDLFLCGRNGFTHRRSSTMFHCSEFIAIILLLCRDLASAFGERKPHAKAIIVLTGCPHQAMRLCRNGHFSPAHQNSPPNSVFWRPCPAYGNIKSRADKR